MISVCAELASIDGGLSRPLTVSTMTVSGTAECKRLEWYSQVKFCLDNTPFIMVYLPLPCFQME